MTMQVFYKAIRSGVTIPFFGYKVPAGFPSPALDYIEEPIDLTKELVKNPLSTFIMKATGNSMVDAFIAPNTSLVIDRSRKPENGDIVVASVNGEFTVKFLKKNDHKAWLVPANSKYREVEITAEKEIVIWGVVAHIITDAKELRRCMP